MTDQSEYNSYHLEAFPSMHAWRAGDVVQMFDGPFSTGIVLGFNAHGYALIARPYAYASGVGTTGPIALTGIERIAMVDMTSGHYNKLQSGKVV